MTPRFKLYAIGGLITLSIGGLVTQRVGIRALQEELATARRREEARREPPSSRATTASRASVDPTSNRQTAAHSAAEAGPRTKVGEKPTHDQGNATPESALETAMAAAARGEVETIARLLVFEPKAREIAESLRASLPESGRAQFPTDESLIALLLAREAPLEGMEVLGRSDLANGGVLLQVAMAGPGGTSKQTDFAFVPELGGWHLVVTAELVTHAAHLLRR